MEININCDLGESSKLHSTENDPLLLEIVNSANIACGYHAGDKPTMEKTIDISKKNNVSIGAHPSFKDPENFGRKKLDLTSNEIRKIFFIITLFYKNFFNLSNGRRVTPDFISPSFIFFAVITALFPSPCTQMESMSHGICLPE